MQGEQRGNNKKNSLKKDNRTLRKGWKKCKRKSRDKTQGRNSRQRLQDSRKKRRRKDRKKKKKDTRDIKNRN